MTLSNTAVPYYYGKFRDDVVHGKIPVCREIAMQMNRIDDRIKNPKYYYDDRAVDGFKDFCENEMVLTDGSDVELLYTFLLWAEDLLSWFYFENKSVWEPYPNGRGGHYVTKRVKYRLTNKQFIITSRASAKSLYLSFIQAMGLAVNTSTTDQITTSPTMKQSEEVTRPIATAISRAKGPLFQFLTEGSLQNTTGSKAKRPKLASTKEGIKNFLTNSTLVIKPMSIDKLQGARCAIATIDEWLSCDIREDPIGAIEQGATKIKDYIIIAVSSEGTVRNGVGDTIKMELASILKGDYNAPHVSIWHYKLDDIKEVNDPAMWRKACPTLGITVSYETYQREVERAEKNPVAANDILAKRFGIPREGYTYFFTYEETKPHPSREFWGLPCSMGADLSRGDDFCSFTFVFPLGGDAYGVKTRCYITERTLSLLPESMRKAYGTYMDEGSLIVMPGVTLDLNDVYDELDSFILDAQYDVRSFGYDPYNAREFVERWVTENSEYGVEKVIQGRKTESVPLGEIKKLAEDRRLIFDQDIMKFTMGNCIVLQDVNGNKMLYKKRADQKIDAVSALMDAYVAYKLHKDMFE